MEPFDVARVTIGIKADKTRLSRTEIPIRIALANDAAFSKAVTTTVGINYNYDDVPDSSVTENAESSNNVWTFAHGGRPLEAWTRRGDSTNHAWHGADLGTASDESFVSPPINVGDGDFAISFRHRYQFESGAAVPGGPEVFFDGGVFEVSEDGGTTWKDVSTYTDPNYPQTIYPVEDNSNVLRGRKAWAGISPAYPNFDYVSLSFGKALAGKTIKVRFRVASDESAGAPGWDVDNITFGGITNLPFPTIVDDRRACTTAPPPPPPRDGGSGATDAGPRADAGVRTDAGGGPGAGGGGGGGGWNDPGAADAGGNPSTPSGSDDGGGCGCVTSPGAGAGSGPLAFVLGGLAMLLRRRRRG
ncbi:MYXO-CTERM sorting domain-containing protein [Pendulispora albinea]|uniref:MYXO-CTERM sorting domain-containing protein n=2 Tax=Pendulispora albinea TaxID=2741071 RepID=A0ABZ2MCK9_9BACT